ncbi:succinyl-diaminopimelate desuccinylase [Segnochrobactrum spirostomi]|uniref:Succinyl-diaminopimelate desuccinylase n=1 Tax=Segnochrobactrum spirostomi TaxID=2608987 RepID=A0A6A7Y1N6_9HYPH|nr:succinyl-diaminopimelate desuccinylase [Segnochrobactrum spirostomi]MQT12606.1 succinyl-diaminopimelate desuccinylase [Segnochrobactrum spirostomi]
MDLPARSIAIARTLITCPSVTPAGAEAFDAVEALLRPAGFAVERPVFTEDGTPAVENLFAKLGTGGPHLTFAGHLDVVPPGETARWTHGPFAAEIAGDDLIGRGAVDMKGAVAAFIAAALDYAEAHGGVHGGVLPGTISFLLTGDEEGPSINGTVKLLDWCRARGERFDAALVGEPTNAATLGDTIKIGRRGSLSGTVTVRGVQGHVAYPERADNPIPALVRLLPALLDPPLDAGTPHFAPSNLELVSVDVGNPSWNVIPAEAQARFNIRYNDLWTPETLAAELARRLATAAAAAGLPVPALAFERVSGGVFLTAPDGRLVEALTAAVGEITGVTPELGTGGGTSDARFIKDYCPVVEFGLVGTTMHQIDERVPLAELGALARLYRRFLDHFFRA